MKDDLLMDNGNKNNLKKPLIYGAIAFLIFVIIVIAVAIFQNSKSSNTQLVPAETQPQDVMPQQQTQPNTQNVSNSMMQTNQNSASQFKPLNVEEANTTNKASENKQNSQINKQNLLTNSKQTVNTQNEKNQMKESKVNAVQQNVAQKEPVAKTVKKVENIKKREPKKIIKNKVVKGKYYIQVAALMRYSKPNRKFLNIIKSNGFNYRFYHTYINKHGQKIKITKILVGPFASKKDAQKAIKKVKSNITQNAYIFRIR